MQFKIKVVFRCPNHFYIDLQGIKERRVLEKWLPKETIRIEDDLDIVRTQLVFHVIFKSIPRHLFSCSFLQILSASACREGDVSSSNRSISR